MSLVCEARKSRQSPAVVLKKVLDIRQHDHSARIAVIEGKDDIGVWPVWFERTHSNANIEPIPASGKSNVIRARTGITRNRDINNSGIIYIVDRDYDDNESLVALDDVYCTDRYSIENYFLSNRVIDSIFNVGFSCAGDLATKKKVQEEFASFMDAYRIASHEVQFRSFTCRRLRVEGVSLPKKFSGVVNIDSSFEISPLNPDQILIKLPDIPIQTEKELRLAFSKLDFETEWRGKFHLLALKHFVTKAQEEKDTPMCRRILPTDKPSSEFKFSGLNLGELASFSDLPKNLDEFLRANLSD